MFCREKVTGRSRHRTDENGKLILQIEVDHTGGSPSMPHWRDAKTEDLTVKPTTPVLA